MKNVILLFVFLFQISTSFSQINFLNESPASGNMLTASQSQRIDLPVLNVTLNERLDQIFDSITALTAIKGFTAAMRLPDGSLWKRAKGAAAAIPASVPLNTDYLMGIGSISKSLIATTMLRLQEEGLLDLDDSIGQYLPAYTNISGAATLRQLLSHRTGFNDYLNENPATLNEFFNHLDSIWVADTLLTHFVLAPNFPLGAAWSYSNTNYVLAGRVIESVTGQQWYQVVRQHVLDPLGLTHTFAYPWETPGTQALAHVFFDLDGMGDVDDWQGAGLPDGGFFSLAGSAGGYISNPEDLVTFSERVYGGHLLSAASLAEMQTDFVQNGSGFLYGLGAYSIPNNYNLENWGHDGDLVYKSIAEYFPTENISLAVQQNDDRTHNPDDPSSPNYDERGVYQALLDAYLNYSTVTAAPEILPGQNITVFPNPADTYITVRLSENAGAQTIQLTDIYGKVLISQFTDHPENRISILTLLSGTYRLRVGGFSTIVIKQ